MNSIPAPFTSAIPLPRGFETSANILALGGELKSAICQLYNGSAYISKAGGDLEQENSYRNFAEYVDTALTRNRPQQLATDRHPDYLSTQLGQKLAEKHHIALTSIQHHHAHIAAVMVDNMLPLHSKPVLGIVLDGLGFGEDGTLWGGEILLADYHGFQRLAHLQPVPMIGGSAAIYEPWRNTLAHLLPIWQQVQKRFADTEIIKFLMTKPLPLLHGMVSRGVNSPITSSCGRLFDAVAAALDLHRERIEFEAQAAIKLESMATECFADEKTPYSYHIDNSHNTLQLKWHPMWLGILSDIQKGIKTAKIAARFHLTLIHGLCDVVERLKKLYDFDSIALSGGVFQNSIITTNLPYMLAGLGLRTCIHRQVPPHDGGLALGQAIIAASRPPKIP